MRNAELNAEPIDGEREGRGPVLIISATLAGCGLLFAPFAYDIFMLPKLVMLVVGGGAALILAQRDRQSVVALSPPKITRWISSYMAIVIVSSLASRSLRLSFFGQYQRYDGLSAALLYPALAALVVVVCWSRPRHIWTLLVAIAGASTVAAMYALFQSRGVDAFDFKEASGAAVQFPGSTLGNSNFAGAYFAMAIPLLLGIGLHYRARRLRVIIVAAGAVVVAGLWVTHSRGGLLGALVAIAVLAVFELVPRGGLARIAALGGAGIAVVAFVFATTAIVASSVNSLPGPLKKLDVLRSESAKVRSYEWQAGAVATARRPILGNGPDTFLLAYPPSRVRADGASAGLLLSDKPHNVFIERAASIGVPGLIAYVAIFAVAITAGIRARRQATRDEALMVTVAISALAAYLTQSFFSIDVVPVAIVAWALLGVLITLSDPGIVQSRKDRQQQLEQRKPLVLPTRSRRVTARKVAEPRVSAFAQRAIGGGVCVAIAIPTMLAFASDVVVHSAAKRGASGGFSAALSSYDTSIALWPWNAEYRRLAAETAERAANTVKVRAQQKEYFATAIDRYKQALDLQPGNIGILLGLARTYSERAASIDPRGYDEADLYWSDAVNRDPHNWQLRQLHALALTASANASRDQVARQRASEEFQALVALRPRDYNGWMNLGRTQLALGQNKDAQRSARTALTLVPFETNALTLLKAALDADNPTQK